MITRPMKAPSEPITDEMLETIKYPMYGSPKLDGFRAMIWSQVLTSSMKPIQNKFVQKELMDINLRGLDGELAVGAPNDPDVFENTSGPLRRFDGEPDFKYYVFNNFERPLRSYDERWLCRAKEFRDIHPRVVVLEQVMLLEPQHVINYEKRCLEEGYEGIILQSPTAPYKMGRATAREAYAFKRKPVIETEAKIIGFEEMMENQNEQQTNELGLSKRSSCKSGLVPKNTLGKFICKSKHWDNEFAIGTGKGLTQELRQRIWDDRQTYLGQIITFKYQKYGSIDAPRIPVFLRFRPEWDLSDEV